MYLTHQLALGKNNIDIRVYNQNDVGLHKHSFLELVYVLDGAAEHTLNGETTVVQKGDYYIIDYGDAHQYRRLPDQPFLIVNCLFRPEFIDGSLKNCSRFEDIISNYLIKLDNITFSNVPTRFTYHDGEEGAIARIVKRMMREYSEKSPGYLEIMRCYLIEIIILTMRQICSGVRSESGITEYIVEYVEKNYMNPVTLGAISETLNYSVPYVSKQFKCDMGITFRDYLHKVRCGHGCRLLSNTDKKVEEIAQLVGYGDSKYFCRVFKKVMGMTTGEFKKRGSAAKH